MCMCVCGGGGGGENIATDNIYQDKIMHIFRKIL